MKKMSEDWFKVQNEPIRKLKKKTLRLAISRRIRDDKGLTIVTIEGTQQGGKSTYAMRALMDMYGNNKDVVLGQIVMSANGFKDKIQAALHGNYREIAVVWDDLSVEGSASTWMTAPMMVKKLAGLGDTLGIATKAFFMTSPSGDMIKAFRNYNKYKVLISNGRHEYERVARGYRIGKSPMNQKWCSLEFEDYYDIRIPFYDEYYKMRQALSVKAVQEFGQQEEEDISKRPISSLLNPNRIKEKISIGEARYKDVRWALDLLTGKDVTEDAIRMMLSRKTNNNRTPVI